MGRQVRRVPLDFKWPIDTPYHGFVMPDDLNPIPCSTCQGMGLSTYGRHLYDRWWGYVPFSPMETGSTPFTADIPEIFDYARRKMIDSRAFYDRMFGTSGEETIRCEAERLCAIWNESWQHHLSQEDVDALLSSDHVLERLTHRFDAEVRTWIRLDRSTPTIREVNLWTTGVLGGMISVPAYSIHKAAASRAGDRLDCPVCNGEGSHFRDAEHRQAHDEWMPTQPPSGEGWQIWETVSEGSPQSPVCSSPQSLARHMANEDSCRDDGMGYEGWLAFIETYTDAPSGIGSDNTMMPGHIVLAGR